MSLAREKVVATPRKTISRSMRNAVLMDQKGCCAACRGPLAFNAPYEVDHIIPLELGGEDCTGNWQVLCPPCHKAKTAVDIGRIRKAQRNERQANPETRRRSQRPIKSRGFAKDPLR